MSCGSPKCPLQLMERELQQLTIQRAKIQLTFWRSLSSSTDSNGNLKRVQLTRGAKLVERILIQCSLLSCIYNSSSLPEVKVKELLLSTMFVVCVSKTVPTTVFQAAGAKVFNWLPCQLPPNNVLLCNYQKINLCLSNNHAAIMQALRFLISKEIVVPIRM